jgi:hypothetical protein
LELIFAAEKFAGREIRQTLLDGRIWFYLDGDFEEGF